MGRGEEPDFEAVFNEILDESRKTLKGIQDNDMEDEVGAVLRDMSQASETMRRTSHAMAKALAGDDPE